MRLPIKRFLAPSLFILLSCCGNGVAQAQTFTVEAMGGSAYNFPTPLTVSQSGYPDIRFSAHYDTKPFGPFYPYYSWRASFWNEDKDQAWEVTQVHHRLFLANNPPEIQFFAIHFGYNLYMAGHAWKRHGFVYHVDGGILICSPENTVRGQKLDDPGHRHSRLRLHARRWRGRSGGQPPVSTVSTRLRRGGRCAAGWTRTRPGRERFGSGAERRRPWKGGRGVQLLRRS